jgi:DNA-binding NarL/FixJ family response regulator
VVDQEGCSQQQSQIERILHYIAYAETSVSKAKHVRLLNKRQQQILEHLAEGKSNKEISQTIYLAEGTVKNHITVIFNYLGVTNRTQAAIKVSRRTALPLSCGNL